MKVTDLVKVSNFTGEVTQPVGTTARLRSRSTGVRAGHFLVLRKNINIYNSEKMNM